MKPGGLVERFFDRLETVLALFDACSQVQLFKTNAADGGDNKARVRQCVTMLLGTSTDPTERASRRHKPAANPPEIGMPMQCAYVATGKKACETSPGR